MSLARAHTWAVGDLLKSADLNGEFNNILLNPIALISPSTGAINFNLQSHINLVITAISATSGSTGAVLTVSTAGTPVWTTSGSGSASAGSGGAKNTVLFTAASTTYVPSSGVASALVEVWGAGGGGGGANGATNSGGAGGGGGYASRAFAVTTSWSIAITVGAGGTGGVNTSSGTSGSLTLFNSSVNPLTGNGGVGGGFGSTGGAGGTGTGGTVNQTGWFGLSGDAISGLIPVPGVPGFLGVGYGGAWHSTGGSVGGPAQGFAASGAGGGLSAAGGNGAQGLVRITEFA